jgi:hypothetical protein|tara:strand:- start:1471 stop:1842 length:372 start_codon:yes stop_codon:yes gene_type:complete
MKLVDILNEVEQNEVVTEVVTPQVDEIGKFFVVTKPIGKMDDVDNLIKELTITELMSLSIEAKDILGIFKDKLGAKRAGSESLKEYESSLEEMMAAVESFRSAKIDIEEKKRIAKEKIQKLKQ